MRLSILTLVVGAALLTQPAAPARANDSTAETAAGGLVLTESADIDMLSEDLYVSAERIRVGYVFRNQSDADVTTIVAFPLPERNLAEEAEMDVARPREFLTLVAGRPVEVETETRAFLGEEDVGAILAEHGIPLMPGDDWQPFYEAIEGLSDAAADRLAARGLLVVDRYEVDGRTQRYLQPLWRVRETYYWEQTFPAGEDLAVEHSYTPGVGGTAGSPFGFEGFRESEYGRELIARYCMDEAFLAGVDRMFREAGEYPMLYDQRIAYILTTGANWRSPIGEFRLVVDKGDPDNIVSFCGEGVRKISPTRFEVRHTDWRPDRDLDVMILVNANE